MAKYYPPRGPLLNDLFKEFKSLQLEGIDEQYEDWQEHLAGLVHCTRAVLSHWVLTGFLDVNSVERHHPRRRRDLQQVS